MKRVILVVIAAVIIIGLVLGGFSLLGAVYADTNGVGIQWRDIRGGSNVNGGGDLLDTTTYVTGWTGTSTSEKIVIQGHFRGTGTFEPAFERYWYEVELVSDNPTIQINGATGTTWKSPTFTVPDFRNGQWYPMQIAVLILTNPCQGKIHIELWGHINDLNPWSSDDGLLASDEAYLKSGIGRMFLAASSYEEGMTATINVETGYAHSVVPGTSPSDQGWFVNIYDPSGAQTWQTTVSDNFNGQVKWPIPTGSWKSDWNNRFLVVLRNELIDQDQRAIVVIEAGATLKQPNQPTATLVKGEEPFTKGEIITVRLSAEQNPIGYPIAGFTVSVVTTSSAGAVTDYIMKDVWYAAVRGEGSIYYTDVTFAFPEAGFAELWGSTVDTHNYASGDAMLKFTIAGMGNDQDQPKEFNILLVVAIVAIAAALIVAVVLIKRLFPWGLVIGIILLGGAAIGIWYVVTVML